MTDRDEPRREDDDAFAERIARPLRASERASHRFEEALLDAIHTSKPLPSTVPRRRATPLSPAWWSASTIRLSPLASLALAAGIAAMAVLLTRHASQPAAIFQPA